MLLKKAVCLTKKLLPCLTIILLASCTSKQMYNAIQEQAIQKCQKESISYADYDACKQEHSKSYQHYENERQTLLKNNKTKKKSDEQNKNKEN